jgi:hypothetical protein
MRLRIVVLLLLIACCLETSAQVDTTRSKSDWFATFSFGTLLGRNTVPSLTLSLLSGVQYGSLHAGVGVGFDTYHDWKTMPVFTSLGFDLLPYKEGVFFLQTYGGFAKAWPFERGDFTPASCEGGYFVHPMIGYRMRQGKIRLHFLVGYKIQRISYYYEGSEGQWGGAPKVSVIQDMERVSIQMAFGLP